MSAACITQLAHEETHPRGPLQLHLRFLRQEVREAGQCQIPQAEEPPRKAGDLKALGDAAERAQVGRRRPKEDYE